MIDPARTIGILWLAWLVGWWLASFNTKRTVARQPTGSRLAYAPLQWFGGALLVHPVRLGGLFVPVLSPGPAAGWAAVGVVVAGAAFAVWARVHLGRNWSAVVTLKDEHALVRSGPYGITRHPIYTGIVCALLPTAVIRGTPGDFLGAALLTLGFVLKIRQEERLMDSHFGAAYAEYRAQVPMLVPRPFRRTSGGGGAFGK
ncbi:MAG TPA: isoprenylcysteine carboxylmethyltransferase family protein [Gemmatimonadaceae bacterium]|nr:isoprenylcysteine carboxylmethyltransferase family protein [Gemmatimonadaceae bacterium]